MSDYLSDILPLAAKGYCCSQILALLALSAQAGENPNLVRALGGLCHGLGQCGQVCGVLTGGCCVLGLYLGKGAEAESAFEHADVAVSQYVEWFTQSTNVFGGVTCADILGDSGKPDAHRCGALLSEAWARILGILTDMGVDPTEAGCA